MGGKEKFCLRIFWKFWFSVRFLQKSKFCHQYVYQTGHFRTNFCRFLRKHLYLQKYSVGNKCMTVNFRKYLANKNVEKIFIKLCANGRSHMILVKVTGGNFSRKCKVLMFSRKYPQKQKCWRKIKFVVSREWKKYVSTLAGAISNERKWSCLSFNPPSTLCCSLPRLAVWWAASSLRFAVTDIYWTWPLLNFTNPLLFHFFTDFKSTKYEKSRVRFLINCESSM